MTYLVQNQSWALVPRQNALVTECTCQEARKLCAPPFVFSISGQVGFRHALLHLLRCSTPLCKKLCADTFCAMKEKMQWLFAENALLGCVVIQPSIYGARRVIFSKQNFKAVAHHLAHCPRESCAKLRRSMMLSIRTHVNPAHVRPTAADEETDEDQTP
jgi:hypothetical protein